MMNKKKLWLALMLSVSVMHCAHSNPGEPAVEEGKSTADLPEVYKKFVEGITVYMDGDEVVIETRGVPNHASPYWGVGDDLYEAPHAGMVVNPNSIAEQNLTFRLPASPKVSASISATPLGPIGVAVNGVALYNQYAGPNQPLEREIATFDRYHGHPQQFGQYHYHIEPVFLSTDDSKLVGFLLDGFPVYGRKDMDGSYPAELDAANGHLGATEDYPNGIYHYHVTADEPYISGGFRGTAGSATW